MKRSTRMPRRQLQVKWGLVQVVLLLGGFILAQFAGSAACTGLSWLVTHGYIAVMHRPPEGGQNGLLAGVLAGYLTASLWSLWYIGRLGETRIRDGSKLGIGWRAAPGYAYLLAVFCALGLIIAVACIVALCPPDIKALQDLPGTKLFNNTSGPKAVLLAVLVVLIAPPVEEFVFRGGVFAALSSRFSPLWAGAITSLLFMALHAPEKIHYPPGFIDVGLMAAAASWLRVKFNSIKPGILLHALYNAGLLVASGTLG